MCEYTCAGGKMTRGITVGATYEAVLASKGETPTKEAMFRAQVVGWCIEWMQACFLVLDDIMDDSSVRRGQPCWYKVPGVGKMAINDGLILESCIWILLKKHLKADAATYLALTELFQVRPPLLRPLRTNPSSARYKDEPLVRIIKEYTAPPSARGRRSR